MAEVPFDSLYQIARRSARVHAAQAVRRGLATPADRDDFAQEAVIACWLASKQFDPTRSSLRTFIEHVVRNRVASVARTGRRHRGHQHLTRRNEPQYDAFAGANLRLDLARARLALDSREEALALLLTSVPAAEAGQLLGVSRSTVYKRIARVQQKLIGRGIGAYLGGLK